MQTTLPPFYDRYIKLVNDLPMKEAFQKYQPSAVFDFENLSLLGDNVYAENKWTAKQIIQHCIDTERVMAYRAMRFARHDKTELPGFDENLYAENAFVEHVSLNELLEEFALLRQSTLLLFAKLSEKELERTGTASTIQISVEHIGYMLLGHAKHHQNVISERYYPLI